MRSWLSKVSNLIVHLFAVGRHSLLSRKRPAAVWSAMCGVSKPGMGGWFEGRKSLISRKNWIYHSTIILSSSKLVRAFFLFSKQRWRLSLSCVQWVTSPLANSSGDTVSNLLTESTTAVMPIFLNFSDYIMPVYFSLQVLLFRKRDGCGGNRKRCKRSKRPIRAVCALAYFPRYQTDIFPSIYLVSF